MKTKSYMFHCRLKNGKRDTRIGYGANTHQAAENVRAMHFDVDRVTPNYVILSKEAV